MKKSLPPNHSITTQLLLDYHEITKKMVVSVQEKDMILLNNLINKRKPILELIHRIKSKNIIPKSNKISTQEQKILMSIEQDDELIHEYCLKYKEELIFQLNTLQKNKQCLLTYEKISSLTQK
jgi:hypothetical protein